MTVEPRLPLWLLTSTILPTPAGVRDSAGIRSTAMYLSATLVSAEDLSRVIGGN